MFRNAQGLIPPIAEITLAVTATAGGGKATAKALTAAINVVGTVATAADSVLLPAALPGLCLWVKNAGANSMQVFGQGTDTINAVATGTGVAQAAGLSAMYVCAEAGKWDRLLSA